MGLSCPLEIACFVPAKVKLFGVTVPFGDIIIKSFIDEDGWILTSLFFLVCVFL